MPSAQAHATTSISLPGGGGGIGETFQADPFTGAGSFSIPIAVSPGRDGSTPQLSIDYSTGHGNDLFGLGWRLALPRIARKTERGPPLR